MLSHLLHLDNGLLMMAHIPDIYVNRQLYLIGFICNDRKIAFGNHIYFINIEPHDEQLSHQLLHS
jgi:hypothetical protein